MCPVVLLALLLSFILLLFELTAAISVNLSADDVKNLKEDQAQRIRFTMTDDLGSSSVDPNCLLYEIQLRDGQNAKLGENKSFLVNSDNYGLNKTLQYNGSFLLTGHFLGLTQIRLAKKINTSETCLPLHQNATASGTESESEWQPIHILRNQSKISQIFTISVVILVSLNYINMGCALDLGVVNTVVRKPVAPIAGFVCQYLCMPLISYLVGWILLNEDYLRLGLFVFGCSPGGGASNMWTILLGGNLNLSVTMTFLSTLFAMVMMPIWLFTLGRNISNGLKAQAPFRNIFASLGTMTIFLGIGLLFQRYLPRVAKICRRILAPVSVAMIIFIIIFGTYANWFMFKLMSWNIILAAAINVWSGFLIGLVTSIVLQLPTVDRIAISVETGIQNTGISIVLLGLSLTPPFNDLASVVPVASSVMTPIPLSVAMIWMKVTQYRKQKLDLSHKNSNEISSNKLEPNLSSSTLINSEVVGIIKQVDGDSHVRHNGLITYK